MSLSGNNTGNNAGNSTGGGGPVGPGGQSGPGDDDGLRYDLEFAPTPLLVEEVLRRFDVAVLVGLRSETEPATKSAKPNDTLHASPDHGTSSIFVQANGAYLPVLGLLSFAMHSRSFDLMGLAEQSDDDSDVL